MVLMSNKFHILAFSETWLNSKIEDSVIIQGFNYHLIRSDRQSRKGGGVAILISDLIPFQKIKVPKIPNSDICCIDVFSPLNQQKIRLIVVYRPTTKETLEHLTSLIDCLVLLSSIDYPYYILGDFNFPNFNWASPNPFPNTLTPSESIFLEFFHSSNLEQIVQAPTRNQNYLDLVLTSDKSLTSSLSVEAPMGGSDHNSIIFDIKLNFKSRSKSNPRYQFNKANYSHINGILANIDWVLFFYDCIDVESCYNKFLSFLHTIIRSCVPLSNNSDSLEHFPVHIQRLHQYRKNLWKGISKPHIKEKFIETSKKLEHEISKFIRNRENKKLSNINTKFDYISSFMKQKHSNIPSLIGQNNQLIFSNQIKSNILADQFSSVFSNHNFSSQTFSFSNHFPLTTIQTISIDPQIVFDIISRLDNSNNTSPDGVPNIFYKKCRDTLVIPLTHIFSMSILNSKIPSIWKKAIINPIPKKTNPQYPIDFRPISLLCSSSKILEKIIANELQSFIESNKILPACQHGFRKAHSVSTQLLEVMDDFTYALENKNSIDTIYFDLAKAFDTVPHSLLVSKLYKMGIQGNILSWINDYLSNRTFTVRVSEEKHCTSGVPQGSILGPLLFITFISDLPTYCATPGITLKLFADDLKAYNVFKNRVTEPPLQIFINKFSEYCHLNGLKIAIEKCSVLYLGNSNPSTKYFINDIVIPHISSEDSVRDLGIHFSHDLKWDKHINIITRKAIRCSYSIFKSIKSRNPKILTNLFNIYVRPILEFSSSVFNPHLDKDIKSIEKVQKDFLRWVFRRINPKTELPEYHDLLYYFKQESLFYRRIKADPIYSINMFVGL
uniref:Reverse transcriptase domain-containing protein n=1 Tax=Meloidogyne enterolobii TaxID=390850 RepID=A0A6V7UTD5_MELEN|nr:unnamed protein product [Meloidogyne enterolobii]